jgi:hypothetical protein
MAELGQLDFVAIPNRISTARRRFLAHNYHDRFNSQIWQGFSPFRCFSFFIVVVPALLQD